ncbi:MAG TPA: NAD(P)-dependent alcohol dehydrogenase [Acidobacteriota bacterium]|nr:NAD(P)-dependent alcohol dehydrogenase [Acidobacteriota bacterium]
MFHALAVKSPKGPLEPFSYEPKPLAANEVEIQITHCGVCHSDVHLADGDWGDVFPLVPGHEIVGTIVQAGSDSDAKPGTRVGVGWQRGSCHRCEYCQTGQENLCAVQQATCMGNFGGFADRIRVDGAFAIPIPEQLKSEHVAPLLCGGATVYSPLRQYARSYMRVGVIGVGGLGHLAIQFANKMGCEVTAISTTKEKEAEAISFGAHHFVTSPKDAPPLDIVLNTASASIDYGKFLAALKPRGVFVQLGADPNPIQVNAMKLMGGHTCLCGSAIASPRVIRELLDFAARHGIRAKVEVVPMREANAALERTRTNKARYRMVLEN